MAGRTLDELLEDWEEARAAGKVLTAEDLCRDCPERLPEIRRQLAAFADMDGWLRGGPPTDCVTPDGSSTLGGDSPTATAAPATPLGRYRVIRPHAEGALGEVLLAHDLVLERPVALKRIRNKRAGEPAVRRRFLREAAITGQLQHPGVVPIYDLTTDAAGRSSYAMRFIDGESLESAIRRLHGDPEATPSLFRGAAFRGLLQRFVGVCNTVAYAHAQGVIHRDLKPANIMLGHYGETLVVDWGLAKRLAVDDGALSAGEIDLPAITADETMTRDEALIGTPAYMSPEQAGRRTGDVGKPSDVFALGAILYAIVTGRPPYDGKFAATALESALGGTFPVPRVVNPAVPPALEAVCLKATAFDPKDRYASAKLLADDVDRWLADEPVTAWPEPVGPRLWRWARRHRPAVAGAAVALMVGLVCLAVVAVILKVSGEAERQARSFAQSQERLARGQQLQAEFEARKTAAVADFLTDLFQSSDPLGIGGSGYRPGGRRVADLTARQLLDGARDRLKDLLRDQPAVRANMLDHIGNVYRSLGMFDQAGPLLREGLTLRRDSLGESHPDVAASLFHLGWLGQDEGRFAAAERLYRQSLAIRPMTDGPDAAATSQVAFNLAWVISTPLYNRTGERLREAGRLYADVVRVRKAALGAKHRDVAFALFAQAFFEFDHSGPAAAMVPFQEALAITSAADRGDAVVVKAAGEYFLAKMDRQARRFQAAKARHLAILDTASKVLGEEHPITILILGDYAALLREMGELPEAAAVAHTVIERAVRSPLRWHPQAVDFLISVATYERDQNRPAEAERLARRAYDIARRIDYPKKGMEARSLLAELLRAQGKAAEAEALEGPWQPEPAAADNDVP